METLITKVDQSRGGDEGIAESAKEEEREKRCRGILLCILCALIPPYVSIPVYIPPYFISMGCS